MTTPNAETTYWHIDLPEHYFEHLSDLGLLLGHPDDFPESPPFRGEWGLYHDLSGTGDRPLHTEALIVSSSGARKRIAVPKGAGTWFCFTDFADFPEISSYPSIFEARKRIVCWSACTTNWDGLLSSSIITLDVASESFINQRWQEDWLDPMLLAMPEMGEDAEMWLNGGVQLYLDRDEELLLIHGDYDGKFQASILFRWTGNGWILEQVVPGQFPQTGYCRRHETGLDKFRIGPNSLSRRIWQ